MQENAVARPRLHERARQGRDQLSSGGPGRPRRGRRCRRCVRDRRRLHRSRWPRRIRASRRRRAWARRDRPLRPRRSVWSETESANRSGAAGVSRTCSRRFRCDRRCRPPTTQLSSPPAAPGSSGTGVRPSGAATRGRDVVLDVHHLFRGLRPAAPHGVARGAPHAPLCCRAGSLAPARSLIYRGGFAPAAPPDGVARGGPTRPTPLRGSLAPARSLIHPGGFAPAAPPGRRRSRGPHTPHSAPLGSLAPARSLVSIRGASPPRSPPPASLAGAPHAPLRSRRLARCPASCSLIPIRGALPPRPPHGVARGGPTTPHSAPLGSRAPAHSLDHPGGFAPAAPPTRVARGGPTRPTPLRRLARARSLAEGSGLAFAKQGLPLLPAHAADRRVATTIWSNAACPCVVGDVVLRPERVEAQRGGRCAAAGRARSPAPDSRCTPSRRRLRGRTCRGSSSPSGPRRRSSDAPARRSSRPRAPPAPLEPASGFRRACTSRQTQVP